MFIFLDALKMQEKDIAHAYLKEMMPEMEVTLFERNEKYWGTPAKTKNVLLKFVPEPASRVIELETGAADFAFYVNGSDIDRVNAIDGWDDAYEQFFTQLIWTK